MRVAPWIGLCLVVLAVVHFLNRERDPGERSIFLGSLGTATSVAARTRWAFFELALGGALLLWG